MWIRHAAQDKETKPQKGKKMVHSGRAEDKKTRREIVLTHTEQAVYTTQYRAMKTERQAGSHTHTHTFVFLSGVDRRIWKPLAETDGWIEEGVGQVFKDFQKRVDWKSVCFSGCLMRHKAQIGPLLPPFYNLSFVLCLTVVEQHSSLETTGTFPSPPTLRAWPKNSITIKPQS